MARPNFFVDLTAAGWIFNAVGPLWVLVTDCIIPAVFFLYRGAMCGQDDFTKGFCGLRGRLYVDLGMKRPCQKMVQTRVPSLLVSRAILVGVVTRFRSGILPKVSY